MPAYTELPASWQTELEKKTGLQYYLDIVLDPERRSIVIGGKNSVVTITQMGSTIDPDIEYERRPTVRDVNIDIVDPEENINPNTAGSPFSNCVKAFYENSSFSDKNIKVKHDGLNYFIPGEKVTIKGPVTEGDQSVLYESNMIVVSYVDGVEYDTITFTDQIGYSFSDISIIYSNTFKEEIIVRLRAKNVDLPIHLFRGKLLAEPVLGDGKVIVKIGDTKKEYLDKYLIGADSNSNKLKLPDSSGTLISSIEWSDTVHPTLDSNDIYPGNECHLGRWVAEFSTTTLYTLSGPDFGKINCDRQYGRIAHLTGLGCGQDMVKLYSYLFIGDSDNDKLVIVNVFTPSSPSITSSIALSGNSRWMGIDIVSNYVFVVWLDFGNVGHLDCFYVGNKSAPFLYDSLTAGSDGVPADFTPMIGCIVDGNYLYVQEENYIAIFNMSDPANIAYVTRIGGAGSPNYMGGCWDFDKSGNYIYTASEERFVVIDVSTPSSPSLAATLDGVVGKCVRVSGNYAYINDPIMGTMYIINISTPSSPTLVKSFGSYGAPWYLSAWKFEISDSRIYACGYDSLTIIDITDQENPVLLEVIKKGTADPNNIGGIQDVVIDSGYIYCYTGFATSGSITIFKFNTSYPYIQGSPQLTILPEAWGASIGGGDSATWLTGISWENQNPVQILYDLLVTYAGINANLISCSSYFGDQKIGKLRTELTSGDTTVEIDITTPQLIKTGETIIIDGTELTISAGNTVQTGFPPYITLTISSYGGSDKSAGTVVYWKERGTIDTDFSFDAEYDYCDTNGLSMTLTIDKEISILEAMEAVGTHFDGFTYSDNWGVENIFTFRDNSDSAITVSKSTNLLDLDFENDNKDLVNSIYTKYGYNYNYGYFGENSKEGYYSEKIYTGIDDSNKSQWRAGLLVKGDLYLPGFFTDAKSDFVAENKYRIWRHGVKLIAFYGTLQNVNLKPGDRINLVSDYPAINRDVIILGKEIMTRDGLVVKITAWDFSGVYD